MSDSVSTGTRTPEPRVVEAAPIDDPVKSGRQWAQSVSEDPWDPCFLTLDGGGIRGYSSLLLLKELMHHIWHWEQVLEEEEPLGESLRREEDLLPCHYFDFVFGTSTGGLIAVMLARLRMTISDCLATYREVGNDLFGKRKTSIPLRTKYHHEPLERAVERIIQRQALGDRHPWEPTSQVPWDPDQPRVCQSCCLTATHNKNVISAFLLRSYNNIYTDRTPVDYITPYNQGAADLGIVEVTRATSAAPFYFKMLRTELLGVMTDFKDGGIRENNPISAAWSEYQSFWGNTRDSPALMLSIGTGRADQTQDGFVTAWPGPFGHLSAVKSLFEGLEKFSIIPNLLIKFTESEKNHLTMRASAKGENTWYKRLNVAAGLEKMPLDHWVTGVYGTGKEEPKEVPGGATLKRMEDATEAYIHADFDNRYDGYAAPGVKIRQTAERLVRQRRARAKLGGERWTTFIARPVVQGPDDGHAGG